MEGYFTKWHGDGGAGGTRRWCGELGRRQRNSDSGKGQKGRGNFMVTCSNLGGMKVSDTISYSREQHSIH